jgi:hypothetical protein
MTTEEIKSEIQKTLSNVPDHVLKEIYQIILHAEKFQTTESLLKELDKIMEEDDELLKKLAQ